MVYLLSFPIQFNCLLGYQGFFPPNPTLEDDILSESNVKQGLQLKSTVPVSRIKL